MIKISDPRKLLNISYQTRALIVKMLSAAGSGHTGGSLGLADIFTCLYFNELNHNPENPVWPDRDRVILSIGHVAPVFYATLAQAGYFEKSELFTLRKFGSRLQGHPGLDSRLPGIETSSGSLGQGLSIATGMAIVAKKSSSDIRVFSIHGDGELQEGQIWEAAMAAAHYNLDNITAIVDLNGVQIDGPTREVMHLEPLAAKWQAFGWNVIGCDGHNISGILNAFRQARANSGKPSVILARTIMGKGIKTIENDHHWHGRAPSPAEAIEFLCQIEEIFRDELAKI